MLAYERTEYVHFSLLGGLCQITSKVGAAVGYGGPFAGVRTELRNGSLSALAHWRQLSLFPREIGEHLSTLQS